MLKKTKEFHKKIELKDNVEDGNEPVPITYIHVFHKDYPRLPFVKLPEIDQEESELEILLELRNSTRIFSDEPLKLEEISKIMGSCRIVDSKRDPEKRTYPSGGARFPIELYILSFNVKDLDQGAYHYNFKRRGLELLWRKDLKNKRRELISPYLENPAATIVFTSVILRSEVKYGYRAYTYSMIEAGHMGQNIHLACTELGIGSCSVSGFIDNTLIKILDLTEDEIPIYTISIGKKRRI